MRIGLLTSIPLTHRAFFGDWVRRWNDTGHTTFPASGPEPAGELAPLDERFTVIEGLSQSPGVGTFRSVGEIRRWCFENDLDVVLTSTATASTAARLRQLPCPVVYFCHGLHWSGSRPFITNPYGLVERAMLRHTAGVITMNSDDYLWFGGDATPIPHLRLNAGIGLDLDAWPASPPPMDRETLRLTWIGALASRKRPFDALEVARHLADQGINVELNILGQGPLLSEVSERARDVTGVHVRGQAPALGYLQTSHALIHTATWEGLARVLLESAAVGRPSFGYDVKGVRDAPGVLTTHGRPDPVKLAGLVAEWWLGLLQSPDLDRDALDWRIAHSAVTALLARVVHGVPAAPDH